jgi:hypothetical protein
LPALIAAEDTDPPTALGSVPLEVKYTVPVEFGFSSDISWSSSAVIFG